MFLGLLLHKLNDPQIEVRIAGKCLPERLSSQLTKCCLGVALLSFLAIAVANNRIEMLLEFLQSLFQRAKVLFLPLSTIGVEDTRPAFHCNSLVGCFALNGDVNPFRWRDNAP